MIDGVCFINGEDLISHLKKAVGFGVDEVIAFMSQGKMGPEEFMVSQAAITGMGAVGMWVEECVIQATQEKFRETLDNEWPSL